MSVTVRFSLAAIVLLIVAGCDFRGGVESAHPLFINAEAARESGNHQAAADFFHRYLAVRYDSPQTHLRLATLYDENLDVPLQAVYHYQQFLHYAPDSPEREQVTRWKEAAKRKYYLRARLEYNDPEDVEMLKNSLEKNRVQLDEATAQNQRLLDYVEGIKKQLAAVNREQTRLKLTKEKAVVDLELAREQLGRLREQNAVLLKERDAMLSRMQTLKEQQRIRREKAEAELPTSPEALDEDAVPAEVFESEGEINQVEKVADELENIQAQTAELPDAETVSSEAVSPPRQPDAAVGPKHEQARQTYQVQRGDTLIGISRQFYGSGRHFRLIFEANRHILTSESSLAPGQTLTIPALPKESVEP